MRLPATAFIVFVAALVCALPSLAFDKALIGSWQGNAKNSDVRWDIRFGGAFTWTRQGPQGSVSATGEMTASDGQWMKSFAKEGSDSGSYTISGPDKFITVSNKFGRTEWTRLSSESATSSNSYASPTVTSSSQYPSEHHVASVPAHSRLPAYQSFGSAQHGEVAQSGTPAYQPANPSQNAANAGDVKHGSHGTSKLKQFFKNVAPMVGAAADIAAGSGSSNYGNSYYPQSAGDGGGGGQSDFGLGRLAGLAGAGGGGDVHSMLINNFPLPAGADEAERFGLPGLGRLAGGGMRKREFRSVF